MRHHTLIPSFLAFAIFAAAVAAVAMTNFTACASKRAAGEKFATTRPTYNEKGNAVSSARREESITDQTIRGIQQKPTPVTEGPTPLVYLFDLGGPLRVVDVTSNVAIATAVAPARSLVRIDDRHGVTVGSENVLPGPLPAGHRYAIYLEPTTDNTIRQSTDPRAFGSPSR